MYTNPDFFLDEWIELQRKIQEENRQRKKEISLKRKQERGDQAPSKKRQRGVYKIVYQDFPFYFASFLIRVGMIQILEKRKPYM